MQALVGLRDTVGRVRFVFCREVVLRGVVGFVPGGCGGAGRLWTMGTKPGCKLIGSSALGAVIGGGAGLSMACDAGMAAPSHVRSEDVYEPLSASAQAALKRGSVLPVSSSVSGIGFEKPGSPDDP
jgi:hypothetical protein